MNDLAIAVGLAIAIAPAALYVWFEAWLLERSEIRCDVVDTCVRCRESTFEARCYQLLPDPSRRRQRVLSYMRRRRQARQPGVATEAGRLIALHLLGAQWRVAGARCWNPKCTWYRR